MYSLLYLVCMDAGLLCTRGAPGRAWDTPEALRTRGSLLWIPWSDKRVPCPSPMQGSRVGQQLHRAGSCHAARLEIWGCSAEILVDVQGREKSCEHHAGHSGTCWHSHSLPHPQPPPPAPMGTHCFGSDEPHVRGSTSVAILQAQLCPSPAPALSSLRVQQGQSNKNSQCSPQLVPPQTLAMESCQSLGSPMGWAGFQPSLSVLGDSSTSQPQTEQGTWGSPNWGSNW